VKGQAPSFFRKNRIDLDVDGITITVTDATATDKGDNFVDFVRNRKNSSGWATTGSNDAANTEFLIVSTDEYSLTDIFLFNHNFKAYTIQYWNGSSFVDFSTPIKPKYVSEIKKTFAALKKRGRIKGSEPNWGDLITEKYLKEAQKIRK